MTWKNIFEAHALLQSSQPLKWFQCRWDKMKHANLHIILWQKLLVYRCKCMDLTWLNVIQINYALLVYISKCMDLDWLTLLRISYALSVYRCKCMNLAWQTILQIKYAFKNDIVPLVSTSIYIVIFVSLYWFEW